MHLQIGEPDLAPKNIIEAGVKALRGGYTITHLIGLFEVKDAIVNYVKKYKNIDTNRTK